MHHGGANLPNLTFLPFLLTLPTTMLLNGLLAPIISVITSHTTNDYFIMFC